MMAGQALAVGGMSEDEPKIGEGPVPKYLTIHKDQVQELQMLLG